MLEVLGWIGVCLAGLLGLVLCLSLILAVVVATGDAIREGRAKRGVK